MAATSSLYAGGKGIKSIQRGTTNLYPETTSSASINAVDTNKAFVSSKDVNGVGRNYTGAESSNFTVYATLGDSTTVNMKSGRSWQWYVNNSYSEQGTVAWEVVEYE